MLLLDHVQSNWWPQTLVTFPYTARGASLDSWGERWWVLHTVCAAGSRGVVWRWGVHEQAQGSDPLHFPSQSKPVKWEGFLFKLHTQLKVRDMFGQRPREGNRAGSKGQQWKLWYQSTCLGCSQAGHHNATLSTQLSEGNKIFFHLCTKPFQPVDAFNFTTYFLLLSPSWWRQLTWIPGTTTSWASIPMVCWWPEPLLTSAPTPQASESCSLASPATCSCCPSGSELLSSGTTLCVEVRAQTL